MSANLVSEIHLADCPVFWGNYTLLDFTPYKVFVEAKIPNPHLFFAKKQEARVQRLIKEAIAIPVLLIPNKPTLVVFLCTLKRK
jgi:hypothetical protein